MPKIHVSPDTITDEEFAAIAAAIAVVTETAGTASSQAAPEKSAWKSASLLEATQRRKKISHVDQLASHIWRSTICILVVGLVLSTTPAKAQEAAPSATPSRKIRIALAIDTTSADIALPDGGVIRDATTGDTLAELPAQSHWKISTRAPGGFAQLCFGGEMRNSSDTQLKLAAKKTYSEVAYYSTARLPNLELRPLPKDTEPKFWLPLQAYVVVPAAAEGTFALSGKLYRGALQIKPRTGSKQTGVDLINYVDLEDYLLSVVPSEMPSGWAIEALKAQAIAARSYAQANAGKHESEGYDIKATTDDQAYSGVSAEHPQSNRAVHETRGQVLMHEGQVVSAYFHSSSGGCTELAEHVWARPVPYLRAVADYDDESPHFAWTRSADIASAEQALAKANKNVGGLLSITPVMRGVSPRVRWLLATGTDRSLFISGEEARRIFGLPSTCFNIGAAPDSYVFAGRGYGHGLGMSQWGAKKLAEAGYTAAEILSYYYKDVTLNQI